MDDGKDLNKDKKIEPNGSIFFTINNSLRVVDHLRKIRGFLFYVQTFRWILRIFAKLSR